MENPEHPQKQRDDRCEPDSTQARMPFDISDLDRIPETTDEDPPYRNWWVIDGH